ncbi:hypothetical protein [Streptomyces sp. NPDC090132]|uniref:hypothetical protein n=1 Tax=Streptomyces sp. NPDC090132 TaxID=3365955 RepID=UPI003808F10D
MGFLRRTETAADDNQRTGRLLQGLEDAYATRTGDPVDGGPLDNFEQVVISAAVPPHDATYPPDGHSYPRR